MLFFCFINLQMALLEKYLVVKKSTLPGAGKGLFTKVFIPKGTRVIEYKGEVLTWKEVEKMADDRNGYVFYFNSKYCIDAWKTKKSMPFLLLQKMFAHSFSRMSHGEEVWCVFIIR